MICGKEAEKKETLCGGSLAPIPGPTSIWATSTWKRKRGRGDVHKLISLENGGE